MMKLKGEIEMNKLPNMKLIPMTNPNYKVKESVDELIKICKEKTIYIIKSNLINLFYKN